jgi:hypothetical protein
MGACSRVRGRGVDARYQSKKVKLSKKRKAIISFAKKWKIA